MQNFKVFGPNDKLCGRMDRRQYVYASTHGPLWDTAKQPRDSRETRETPCVRLAKQPRICAKLRETPTKHPRNLCETVRRTR